MEEHASGQALQAIEPKRPLSWWQLALWGVAIVLLGFSLIGGLVVWPTMDQANYILQAARMAQGDLPYRDFYEFVTPAGQWLGALLIRVNGLSLIGLRLWIVIGWCVELWLINAIVRDRMPRAWRVLLLSFLTLTGFRYPVFQHHFGSGFCALLAVYLAWRSLKGVYWGDARMFHRFLIACGILTGLTFWFTQSLGIAIAGALGVFGVFHCLLHEREERAVSFGELPRRVVATRWLSTWGRYWLLPMLGVHAAWVLLFLALGIWQDFLRDSFTWIGGGYYGKTTVAGYFVTFNQEFLQTIKPLLDGVPWPQSLWFFGRVPVALHLFLIGALPVLGLLGMGCFLPNRFLYRLLRIEDESLLLFWLASLALVVSTFSYSTSMHIVSNGLLPLALGGLVFYGWVSRQAAIWQSIWRWALSAFCVALLAAACMGTALQLWGGSWLPVFPGMNEPLLLTEPHATAPQWVAVVNYLQAAKAKGRSVFVFCETPALYLPGLVRNATRFTIVLPFYNSPAQRREMFQDLEKNKPLYIVDDQTRFHLRQDPRFQAYSAQALRMPEMDAYLRRHYRLMAEEGLFRVYQRVSYFE